MKSEILLDNGTNRISMHLCIEFLRDQLCPCSVCQLRDDSMAHCTCDDYVTWRDKIIEDNIPIGRDFMR